MRAIVRNTYGSPDVLELQEIEKPDVADDEVLVLVRAASVNPADWYSVTGTPYVGRTQMGLRKPKRHASGKVHYRVSLPSLRWMPTTMRHRSGVLARLGRTGS